ncbi:MAG TPA: VOC family protein [Ferruginibacter sp.]|nr:VOC family protein [Ferruginibacter sp.]
MIKGVHTMFYSSDAEGLRVFLRDKLGFKATDAGGGWLIFDLPEADMGCHPSDEEHGAPSGTADISFYCDNIGETVSELKEKGVQFEGNIEDHGYGMVIHFQMPGNFRVQLYQPKYQKK